MNRRNFIGSTAAAVGAGLLNEGCRSNTTPENASGAPAPDARSAAPAAFELEEITIKDLQDGMKSGKYTSRSIAEMYLKRIEALDRKGPSLYAVLETNPEALAIADALDAERKAKGPRGPLHGIPILVKDNIGTADKMTTTAGSTALQGSIPAKDSFVAEKLRAAGAVILGKANMSEWAGWKSFVRGTPGWSGRGWNAGRGGFCRNPYALDRIPSGSSSGSGVAASANFSTATIGTETDGSIVGPSSTNGVVGIKPTIGLISRAGVIPIAHSQDSAGPIARSVADACIILGALTGVDPLDPLTAPSAGKFLTDYTASLDPNGLKGARIGVARGYSGFDDRVNKLLENALDVMKRQGATIIDGIELPRELRFANEFEMEVLYHEFKADLNAYLATLGPQAPIKSLAELIQYNEKHADLELSLFGQELLTKSEERGPLTDSKYLGALQRSHQLSREQGIDKAMQAQNLGAIVAPTGGVPGMLDPVGGSRGGGGGCSTPAAMAGYPIMTAPMGFVMGLPIGLAFFGRAWSESTLIKLAYAFEQETKVRKPPRFLPTAELHA